MREPKAEYARYTMTLYASIAGTVALMIAGAANAQQPQPGPIQQFNADWQAVGSLMGHVLVDVAAIGKDLADAKEALDKAADKIKILTEENERLKATKTE